MLRPWDEYPRMALAGEVCTCGEPAMIVDRSPLAGELGDCLNEDHVLPIRCPWCEHAGRITELAHGYACPNYEVRPSWWPYHSRQSRREPPK